MFVLVAAGNIRTKEKTLNPTNIYTDRESIANAGGPTLPGPIAAPGGNIRIRYAPDYRYSSLLVGNGAA